MHPQALFHFQLFASSELPTVSISARPVNLRPTPCRSPSFLRDLLATLASVTAVALLVLFCSRAYEGLAVQGLRSRSLAGAEGSDASLDICGVSGDEENQQQRQIPHGSRLPAGEELKLPLKKRPFSSVAGAGFGDGGRGPQEQQHPSLHGPAGADLRLPPPSAAPRPEQLGYPQVLVEQPAAHLPPLQMQMQFDVGVGQLTFSPNRHHAWHPAAVGWEGVYEELWKLQTQMSRLQCQMDRLAWQLRRKRRNRRQRQERHYHHQPQRDLFEQQQQMQWQRPDWQQRQTHPLVQQQEQQRRLQQSDEQQPNSPTEQQVMPQDVRKDQHDRTRRKRKREQQGESELPEKQREGNLQLADPFSAPMVENPWLPPLSERPHTPQPSTSQPAMRSTTAGAAADPSTAEGISMQVSSGSSQPHDGATSPAAAGDSNCEADGAAITGDVPEAAALDSPTAGVSRATPTTAGEARNLGAPTLAALLTGGRPAGVEPAAVAAAASASSAISATVTEGTGAELPEEPQAIGRPTAGVSLATPTTAGEARSLGAPTLAALLTVGRPGGVESAAVAAAASASSAISAAAAEVTEAELPEDPQAIGRPTAGVSSATPTTAGEARRLGTPLLADLLTVGRPAGVESAAVPAAGAGAGSAIPAAAAEVTEAELPVDPGAIGRPTAGVSPATPTTAGEARSLGAPTLAALLTVGRPGVVESAAVAAAASASSAISAAAAEVTEAELPEDPGAIGRPTAGVSSATPTTAGEARRLGTPLLADLLTVGRPAGVESAAVPAAAAGADSAISAAAAEVTEAELPEDPGAIGRPTAGVSPATPTTAGEARSLGAPTLAALLTVGRPGGVESAAVAAAASASSAISAAAAEVTEAELPEDPQAIGRPTAGVSSATPTTAGEARRLGTPLLADLLTVGRPAGVESAAVPAAGAGAGSAIPAAAAEVTEAELPVDPGAIGRPTAGVSPATPTTAGEARSLGAPTLAALLTVGRPGVVESAAVAAAASASSAISAAAAEVTEAELPEDPGAIGRPTAGVSSATPTTAGEARRLGTPLLADLLTVGRPAGVESAAVPAAAAGADSAISAAAAEVTEAELPEDPGAIGRPTAGVSSATPTTAGEARSLGAPTLAALLTVGRPGGVESAAVAAAASASSAISAAAAEVTEAELLEEPQAIGRPTAGVSSATPTTAGEARRLGMPLLADLLTVGRPGGVEPAAVAAAASASRAISAAAAEVTEAELPEDPGAIGRPTAGVSPATPTTAGEARSLGAPTLAALLTVGRPGAVESAAVAAAAGADSAISAAAAEVTEAELLEEPQAIGRPTAGVSSATPTTAGEARRLGTPLLADLLTVGRPGGVEPAAVPAAGAGAGSAISAAAAEVTEAELLEEPQAIGRPTAGVSSATPTTAGEARSLGTPLLADLLTVGRPAGVEPAAVPAAAAGAGSAIPASVTIAGETDTEADPEPIRAARKRHPFVRLPTRAPAIPHYLYIDFKAAVGSSQSNPRSAVRLLRQVHDLLAQQTLLAEDMVELVEITEGLVSHAVSRQGADLSEMENFRAVSRLGIRFLVLDAVVSVLIVLGQSPNPDDWERFVSTISHAMPRHAAGQKFRGQAAFFAELTAQLCSGIQKLKRGRRPAPADLLKVKRMLFCSSFSPAYFKEGSFDKWRLDDSSATDGP